MNNPSLKVGLVLSSMEVSAWVYKLLERINEASYASIAVIVLNDCADHSIKTQLDSSPQKGMDKRKFREGHGSMVTRLTSHISNRFKSYPDYQAKKDLGDLLNATPTESIIPETNKGSFSLSSDSLSLLENYEVDVLLNLTSEFLRGDATSSFPYGVWHYKFTDVYTNNCGVPGTRETLAGWSEVGSALIAAGSTSKDDKIIALSYSCPDNTWIQKTNNLSYWKSLSFMPRALEKCHRLGEKAFHLELTKNTPYPWFRSGEPAAHFKKLELLKLLAKKAVQKVRLRIDDRIFFEQWFVLFNLTPETSNQLKSYHYLLPPKDRFWADPFVVYKDDKYYIFIEELLFADNVGFLSVIEMDKQGNYSAPEVILKKPYHLSWPFVFMHEGEYFMIPETADNKTIDLYRCTSFPNQWEHEMTLMENVGAVDTTMLFKDDKWWLFTNIKENEGASYNDELFLFYSDSLFSDQWTAHPANPIVSDVKKARPAGKIFEKNGKLYRPSQNCSHYYGYGLNFNEITVMDETNYQEVTVSSIEPDWDKKVIATHTYNTDQQMTVMDGIIRRRHRGD